MTCIVGLEYNGGIIIGGDSAAVAGSSVRLSTTPKVFKLPNLLIGYTWSFRMGQIIQYVEDVPEIIEQKSNYEYLIGSFVPFIRDIFKDAGWLRTEDSRDEGGQFLIGLRGEIFKLNSDFAVLRFIDGFCAVGSGEDYAFGALRVIKNNKLYSDEPRLAIGIALETAAYFSGSVSAPFVFEELKNYRKGNDNNSQQIG